MGVTEAEDPMVIEEVRNTQSRWMRAARVDGEFQGG